MRKKEFFSSLMGQKMILKGVLLASKFGISTEFIHLSNRWAEPLRFKGVI
ncbi:hypothetical protein [Holospora curviuscula]|nr:hypothetical protein [Holospora curviuscula]